MSMPDLLAGVYRHYKSPLYLVLGYGRDANYEDRDVVVYIGLELTGTARPGARLKVRTAADFLAIVDPATGDALPIPQSTAEYPRRYTYLGPQWAGFGTADNARPNGVGTMAPVA